MEDQSMENEKKLTDYEVLAEVGKKTKNRDITVDEIDKFFKRNKIKAVKGLYSEDDRRRAVDHFLLKSELDKSNKTAVKVLTDRIDELQNNSVSLEKIVDGINDFKKVLQRVNDYLDTGAELEQLQDQKEKLEKEINALQAKRDALSRAISNNRPARPMNNAVESRSQHQQLNPTIQQQ